MAIETICQGCARKLRVADEYAGKKARCPECGMIYTVPGAVDATFPTAMRSSSADTVDSATSGRWQLRIPDGRVYGPVAKSELDQWLREGRITSACHLLRDGSQTWHPADTIYPELATYAAGPAVKQPSRGGNPFADESVGQPYAPSYVAQPMHRSRLAPHRGVLILILAILGWAVCFVFAPFAWAMGSADLRAMRTGSMDPSGMGLTQAGMILGMIQTILLLLLLVLFVVFTAVA